MIDFGSGFSRCHRMSRVRLHAWQSNSLKIVPVTAASVAGHLTKNKHSRALPAHDRFDNHLAAMTLLLGDRAATIRASDPAAGFTVSEKERPAGQASRSQSIQNHSKRTRKIKTN
jgi:hypothetical protein